MPLNRTLRSWWLENIQILNRLLRTSGAIFNIFEFMTFINSYTDHLLILFSVPIFPVHSTLNSYSLQDYFTAFLFYKINDILYFYRWSSYEKGSQNLTISALDPS